MDEPELNVTAVAKKTGIHKATARRILLSLTEGGLLERSNKTGRYAIGPLIFALGNLCFCKTDIIACADPVIETLSELSNESVHLGIFVNGIVTIVMRKESKQAVGYAPRVGVTVPPHASAIGKAFLSELNEEEIDRLYPKEELRLMTPKTVSTKTELKQALKKVKESGISIDSEGSYEGIEGISSLIRNSNGEAVAAITFPIPVYRINQSKRQKLVYLVKLGCNVISYKLGYQNTDILAHSVSEIRHWWERSKSSQRI